VFNNYIVREEHTSEQPPEVQITCKTTRAGAKGKGWQQLVSFNDDTRSLEQPKRPEPETPIKSMCSKTESRNNHRIQPKHKPDLQRSHTNSRGKAGRGWLSDLEGGVDGRGQDPLGEDREEIYLGIPEERQRR
jgi:hypothetical protein